MEKLSLPMDVEQMDERHKAAAAAAFAHFDKHKFGNELLSMSGTLRDALQEAINKEYTCASEASCAACCHCKLHLMQSLTLVNRQRMRRSRKTANVYESSVICERLEAACEDSLEAQHRMRLPSTGRFRQVSLTSRQLLHTRSQELETCSPPRLDTCDTVMSMRCRANYERCEANFRKACIGPSLVVQAERLAKAWHREESRFRHDYHDQLMTWLIGLSLASILLFRFVVCVNTLETAGWVAFVFLQVLNLDPC